MNGLSTQAVFLLLLFDKGAAGTSKVISPIDSVLLVKEEEDDDEDETVVASLTLLWEEMLNSLLPALASIEVASTATKADSCSVMCFCGRCCSLVSADADSASMAVGWLANP